MNTRKCKKCGWEYPMDQPGLKCRVCGEPFEEIRCCACGRLVSGKDRVPNYPMCRECHNAAEREHMKKYNAKRDAKFIEQYKDWKAKVASVPKSYPTLSEEQWMRACRFFGGCATCGDENIDARSFFIQFKDGGRYCDWNVIPQCAKCAGSYSTDAANPFRLAWTRDNMGRSFNRRKAQQRIIEYLGGLLDAASTNTSETTEHSKQDDSK